MQRPFASLRSFRRIQQYNSSAEYQLRKKGFFKEYQTKEAISLQPNGSSLKSSYKDVVEGRASTREFAPGPLPFNDFSSVLDLTFGLKSGGKRRYASAGGCYPLEAYIVSVNIEDVPKGIYHYSVRSSSLKKIADSEKVDTFFNEIMEVEKKGFSQVSAYILLTSVFSRTIEKYGARGWRYLFLEAGFAGQLLMQNSAAFDMGCCPDGGGYDSKLHGLLEVNPLQEGLVMSFALGRL